MLGVIPGSSSSGRASRRPGWARVLPISTGDAVGRQLKTSEVVARHLVHDIVSRGLTTGDRLPLEAETLEEHGVSRESLRERLRLLEAQGLISLKRGPRGGPMVGHLDPANLGRTSTLYYHVAGGTYEELFDAWVVTEALLAERAARNPTARPCAPRWSRSSPTTIRTTARAWGRSSRRTPTSTG